MCPGKSNIRFSISQVYRKTQELGYSELSDIKLTKFYWIRTKVKYISSFHSTVFAMYESKVQMLVCD